MTLKERIILWVIRREGRDMFKAIGDFLGKHLDSTKGKGISKKFLALLLTGTVVPLMEHFGVSHDLVIGIIQIALGYIGAQGIADAAYNFKNGKQG